MEGGPSDRIRTCGILLPKQARYQLRYTRLLSYFIRLGVFTQSRRATNCATPGCSVGIIIPHVEIARKYLLKVFNKLLTVEFCGMSSKFFRPYN